MKYLKDERSTEISTNTLADCAFILYFANATIRAVTYTVLGRNSLAYAVAIFIPYAFLFLCGLMDYEKYFKVDFFAMYAAVLLFFLVSLIIHPEYLPYYTRADFGVWDHVLTPYRGIYAYLFIRIMDSPERIKRNLRISGWVAMPSFYYDVLQATRRGYWILWGAKGATQGTYSVSFGYNVLPFALVFLYFALQEKKLSDIISAVICIFLIFSYGSRGQMVFIALLIIVYISLTLKNSKSGIIYLFAIIAVTAVLIYYYDHIMNGISELLSNLGISSRFLKKMQDGSLADDNGRFEIWQAAIEMIKNNPLGYGAKGASHIITAYISAGYPHNILLEFLIDYGVLPGFALFAFFMYKSIKIIFSSDTAWRDVFIPMFCSSCCLFISLSYWSTPTYWVCLGIGMSMYYEKKSCLQTQPINMEGIKHYVRR